MRWRAAGWRSTPPRRRRWASSSCTAPASLPGQHQDSISGVSRLLLSTTGHHCRPLRSSLPHHNPCAAPLWCTDHWSPAWHRCASACRRQRRFSFALELLDQLKGLGLRVPAFLTAGRWQQRAPVAAIPLLRTCPVVESTSQLGLPAAEMAAACPHPCLAACLQGLAARPSLAVTASRPRALHFPAPLLQTSCTWRRWRGRPAR